MSLLLFLQGSSTLTCAVCFSSFFSLCVPPQRFVGNVDADGVVHHKLPHPIRTCFLRFIPLEWNSSGWVGLRAEVYGCTYSECLCVWDWVGGWRKREVPSRKVKPDGAGETVWYGICQVWQVFILQDATPSLQKNRHRSAAIWVSLGLAVYNQKGSVLLQMEI